MRLRQSLEKVHLANPNLYIVLMGDYNDDPFSPSLSEHLHATRDRELAIQDGAFLYNPFWRRLGESRSFPTSGNEVSICGTHYYDGGEFGLLTRYPKKQEGADSRQHLPPGVQRCSARAARLQLPASRGPIRTAGLRVQ